MNSARDILWFEDPKRLPWEGRQGRVVSPAGRPDEAITCPACQKSVVVYNGNYFCDGWGETCDWALAHPATSKRDRAFCDLVGVDYS